jgi:hypothetical protein
MKMVFRQWETNKLCFSFHDKETKEEFGHIKFSLDKEREHNIIVFQDREIDVDTMSALMVLLKKSFPKLKFKIVA